ncbi:MAG TPA: radical SAM protein [Gemmatimonadaceae bacterium]|nr:radical SAM protein [Gemmatimonadaceae bacterium]
MQALLLPDEPQPAPVLPTIGEQKDIRYHAARARGLLNGPESTGMDYWSINPYVGCAFGCTYCYARYAHRYALDRALAGRSPADRLREEIESMPPWLAFERHVLIKEDAPAILGHELRPGSPRLAALASGEVIVIGTATDPYQPAERRFRITRGILETLAAHDGLSIVVITKSPLITRDVDLLRRITERSSLTIHLSLITMRRELARLIEPRAPTPDARIRALARLRAVGVDVGINVMPVLPGITDNPADLEELVRQVAAAGATHVNACALRLRSTARARYLPFIAEHFPHLADRYARSYSDGHQVSQHYRDGLRRFFESLCTRVGIAFGAPDEDTETVSDPQPTRQLQTELF